MSGIQLLHFNIISFWKSEQKKHSLIFRYDIHKMLTKLYIFRKIKPCHNTFFANWSNFCHCPWGCRKQYCTQVCWMDSNIWLVLLTALMQFQTPCAIRAVILELNKYACMDKNTMHWLLPSWSQVIFVRKFQGHLHDVLL